MSFLASIDNIKAKTQPATSPHVVPRQSIRLRLSARSRLVAEV